MGVKNCPLILLDAIMIFRFVSYSRQVQEVPQEGIHEDDWRFGFYKAYDKESGECLYTWLTYDEYHGWLTAKEREVWKDKDQEEVEANETKDHINPSHYQGYVKELQWLETMQYLPRFRNQESFIAAVELQGRKYWDRNGGKDEEIQELKKGIWYFKFALARLIAGRPIKVNEVNTLIGDMGQGTYE
jgi:hypothetical protein